MANEDFTSNKTSKKVRTRRKSRINPKVIANIIPLSTERRREDAQHQWSEALKAYIGTLNHNDFNIAQHVMKFITQKQIRIDTSRSCEVIPFQAMKK